LQHFQEGGNNMNQRDGFTSGFLAGTIGVAWWVEFWGASSQRANESTTEAEPLRNASLSE